MLKGGWIGLLLVLLSAQGALAGQIIKPSDPRFAYQGRIDFGNPETPVIIWQASTIAIDFEGDSVHVLLKDAVNQSFFNATIDGRSRIIDAWQGADVKNANITGLGQGRHSLVLFKRSEASAGNVKFAGVEIADDAKAFKPQKSAKIQIEFIGDSITAGACNEDDPAADQWENRRSHNAALSYPQLVSDAFAAEYRNIAISGMGVANGWTSTKAGAVWDKLYPDPKSAKADFSNWSPKVVFINLGENDDSFPRSKQQQFPSDFAMKYVAMVRDIRKQYPTSQIVILKGGMWGGAKSVPLKTAWENAIVQLEGSDKQITHFLFTHFSQLHPRVADDKAMADELIEWLKQQDFMK